MRLPSKKKLTILLPLALLLGAGILVYFLVFQSEELPPGLIQVNGRIEGDVATVASKYSGRVENIRIREGETVQEGDVLLTMESERTRAQVRQAEQSVQTVLSRLKGAQTELRILEEDIPLDIDKAQAAVEQAEARLEEARVKESQAERDAARFARLFKQETVAEQRAEEAVTAWEVAKSQLNVAQKDLNRAERELAQARVGRRRIEAKRDEIESIRSEIGQARARLEEVTSILDDLTVRAPVSGTVTSRLVEAGETVSPGGALYEMVNLQNLYLKAYMPETQIGKVALGQEARIHVDAYPDTSFPARVGFIASEAQFTPKEVQTKEERTKLVYEVRLYLKENPDKRLSPGLPADGIIKWQESAAWAPPVW
jgi:HlyD family secretion protein